MQKLVMVLVAIACCQSLAAQVKEGKITYERKVNMHRRITDEAEKAMVPEFNSTKMVLIFSGNESIFKAVPEEADVRDNAGQDDNRLIVHFGSADNEVYRNFSNGKAIELRELGPKKYIVEDSMRHQSWKLEEGSKMVKGYACKKAITKSGDGMDVIAWYSENIVAPVGPEQYGGLPGAILELDINQAEAVFTATDIDTRGVDPKTVTAPTNGKKVTPKEFQKMVDDEFGPNQGGPIRTIRIIND